MNDFAMRSSRLQDNQRFINAKKFQYPHSCIVLRDHSVNPEWFRSIFVDISYICVPLLTHVHWGFKLERDLIAFHYFTNELVPEPGSIGWPNDPGDRQEIP